jgi:hypothetical protein
VSAQHVEHPPEADALFPQPPTTEVALRIAVRRLDLAASVEFEQGFHNAWQEAVQTDSTMPMHVFLRRWADWVSLHRYPSRAARLKELRRQFDKADTREDARAIAEEIAQLLALAGVAVHE